MLFGYAFAVWLDFTSPTQCAPGPRPTPSGAALAAIAALWIAARVAAFLPLYRFSVLDLLFAASVAWGPGRPIVMLTRTATGTSPAFVLALGAASIAFQAWPQVALAVGLDVVLLVIAIMGGRVIPSFTNNTIPGAGARLADGWSTARSARFLLLIVFDVLQAPTLADRAGRAMLHAVRTALWAPLATRGRPILWILHLSYAWVVVHLVLRELSEFDLVPAGSHARADRRRDRRPHAGHDDPYGRADIRRSRSMSALGGRGTCW